MSCTTHLRPRLWRAVSSASLANLAPLLALLLLAGCDWTSDGRSDDPSVACDSDDGGITLPDGFCAVVVADQIGPARHLAVRDNGDVYVMLSRMTAGGGLVALRDTTADGRADRIARFGTFTGTGIALRDDFLFASSDEAIYRFALPEDRFVPAAAPEPVATGFPAQEQHASKSITFDDDGGLYVNVGAPSNACQQQDRTPGSPGQDPCPHLERQAGIWRFDADRTGQTQQADGERFATGLRNVVGLDWHNGSLYVAQHGRDQLSDNWPDLFTPEQNAELPAEEFLRVTEGADFGWPYCYYDHLQGKKVLAPEYGGDGQEVGRCAGVPAPLVAFPGHYAPNALAFYDGSQFPARYRGGAFIAFHGSWNRAPLPQQGYLVAFVPFSGGQPTGDWEVFANGFKGAEVLAEPDDARFRPMGLAVGPDGSLYISDSVRGRIWRVVYTGR